MTSGTKSLECACACAGRRAGLAAFAAFAALAALPWGLTQAAAFDLGALMALLAQRTRGEARFSEEREVRGFDSPLRASGTLSFAAPDRFARHTLEPRPESMEVDGNLVLLKRSGRTRQMALDTVPELAALVEAMRGTLAGNAPALRKHFSATVSGSAALWTLTLTPLARELANQVRLLRIVGAGADLRSVELQLASGERSLMLIEPVAAALAAPTSPDVPARR